MSKFTDDSNDRSWEPDKAMPLDPFGISFQRSPYVQVPQLTPDMPYSAVHELMKQLQIQRKLGREEKATFRVIRNVTSRVKWDLLTLGTTPSIDGDAWSRLGSELQQGHRAEVYSHWIPRTQELVDGASSLHVCAVLSGNEVAREVESDDRASSDTLCRFVAFWAALLFNQVWIHSFAIDRCKIWERNAPDAGDQAQLLDKLEKNIFELLQAGAGSDHQRRATWFSLWDREMATIEAVQKACWNHSKSEWTKGFGPLGLSQLGEAEQAREALLKISRGYKGGLPITAVKSGAARLVDSDLERAGEAATALQLLFSSLGEAGSEVWSGYGRTASLKLDELHSTIQAMVEDPWFGSGEGGKIRRERAYLELKSEALLLRFREELGREDVACTEVAATASQVLYLTDSVRKPLILIEKLEDLLIGRLTACTEGSRMPPPPEVQRVIEAATEIRHLLMGHGAGNRCALHIARLLDQRAVRNWNRSPRMPKPDIQLRILRDAMQAVELAPHNPDIVENLASLVLQIDTGSAAEQESRLKTAKQAVDRAIRSVGSNDELEEVQMRLLEQLDPQEARRETQRRLYEARQSAGK